MKHPGATLIALVLCLVCFGPAPARAQPTATVTDNTTADEGRRHVQLPANLFDHPTAILCIIHGRQPLRIPVPAGKNPTDFCPASAITERYYNIAPGVAYAAPLAPDGSPPPLSRKNTGGGH